jgi:hypothetical protein
LDGADACLFGEAALFIVVIIVGSGYDFGVFFGGLLL